MKSAVPLHNDLSSAKISMNTLTLFVSNTARSPHSMAEMWGKGNP